MSRWSPVYIPEIETRKTRQKQCVRCGNQNKMDDTKTYDIRKHIPGPYQYHSFITGARGTDLPPPFFLTFCLQIYLQ